MNVEDKRLIDLAIRIAVYVEAFKERQTFALAVAMRRSQAELKRIFSTRTYSSFEGLSKAKLNGLIRDVRRSQAKIFSTYGKQLLDSLEAFTNAHAEVVRRVYATEHSGSKKILTDNEANDYLVMVQEEEEDDNIIIPFLFWNTVLSVPIAANGQLLISFISSYKASAISRIENTIRKGWTNNLTKQQVLTELIGDGKPKQGIRSVLDIVDAQGEAVINTSTGHVASTVSSDVTSILYKRYIWLSVMDNRTTEICRGRNLTVYIYGKGPIPPAHINCRSTIAPVNTGANAVDETFNAWIKRQPKEVQDDMLGKGLRNNEITTRDVKLTLTAEQLKSKIRTILSN